MIADAQPIVSKDNNTLQRKHFPAQLAFAAGRPAQGIRLDVAPWPGVAGVTGELARSVDLIIACVPDAFRGFHRQRIYVDGDALAVRSGHPVGAR